VAENVDLPVTLLSRFDLIFIVRDEPNAEKDRNIATHIVKLHSNDILDAYSRDIIKPDLLRKYIAYARKHVKPILTKEAQELVTQFYVQMRSKSQEPNSPVAITARQLEALIRLAEAEAKMRLSSTVDKEDAERAISLFLKFLQSVGIDVETGKVDIDVIMTGKPRSSQERMAVVLETISKMEELNDGKPVKIEDALREIEERGVDRAAAEKLINMLMKNGELYAPKPGYVKKVH
jgi:replicative DNA helicase Mcm (EC 3.6.1.-)